MIARVVTIARWTTVEMLREQVLYVVVLFAALLVASSSILTPLAPGAQKKIVADLGLAAINLLGVLVILLTGSTLLRRERDRRSLDILLTKPLTRLEYLLGKCLGLVSTLLVLMLTMSIIFVVTLQASGFGWKSAYMLAVYTSLLEILVIASIAVLFSTFTSPTLAAMFTLALFVAGHLSERLLDYASGSASAALLEKVSWLVPALGVFNVRGDVVHGTPVTIERLIAASAYAVLYALTALYIAALIFRRRDFR